MLFFEGLTIFSIFARNSKDSFLNYKNKLFFLELEKEIEIDGLKITYEETGNPKGFPVVLMHGWGCDHTTVRSIARNLEDGMRVISVDLPGHGKSSEPSSVWGTTDFANLIKKFIHYLNLRDVSLIGHSFGGRTAIAAAANSAADSFWKIVLIDSAGIKPRRSLNYYYKVYSFKAIKKLSFLFLGKTRGQSLVDKALKKRGSSDYQSASPKMRAIMSKCVNEDLKKILPRIQSPTLLIWGEEDTATPLKDAKLMEKRIPDVGLVSFPSCGHYAFLDNPNAFSAVIREFFKHELQKAR